MIEIARREVARREVARREVARREVARREVGVRFGGEERALDAEWVDIGWTLGRGTGSRPVPSQCSGAAQDAGRRRQEAYWID